MAEREMVVAQAILHLSIQVQESVAVLGAEEGECCETLPLSLLAVPVFD